MPRMSLPVMVMVVRSLGSPLEWVKEIMSAGLLVCRKLCGVSMTLAAVTGPKLQRLAPLVRCRHGV